MAINLVPFWLLVGIPYYLATMFVNEITSIVSSPVLMFADDTKSFMSLEIGKTTLHHRMTWIYYIARWSQQ